LLPTLPLPSQQLPQFMLHVFRDNITTSVTLSDTDRCRELLSKLKASQPHQVRIFLNEKIFSRDVSKKDT
jgi:hypothetical protein